MVRCYVYVNTNWMDAAIGFCQKPVEPSFTLDLNCYFLYFVKVWEGLNAVKGGRTMLGETDPVSSVVSLI